MKHNLFVPDILTAKSLIANYVGNDQVTINVFVVDRDTLQSVLNEIKKDQGHLTVTGVSLKKDKNLYPGKRIDGPLSAKDRIKYIKQLAGQTFKANRGGIETGFTVTADGEFLSINNGKTYKSPSTAISEYIKGKVKNDTTNGWTGPKNEQGLNLDQAIRNLFD
jgi:hypothetical protein